MQDTLVSIGKAAKRLGVSIDTLRRWDTRGRLKSVRSGTRGHRFYQLSDIDRFSFDIEAQGKEWAEAPTGMEPASDTYCHTRDIFQARLEKFQSDQGCVGQLSIVSLVTAIAGEIGNNSFDHNMGNWPDIPGIYFSYSWRSRKVVLADRGIGILASLKRVRPQLSMPKDALHVAFTETFSGRFPEVRGNGLKFVRSIVVGHPLTLYFQTGNAYLSMKHYDKDISIQTTQKEIRGCFATIGFEGAL